MSTSRKRSDQRRTSAERRSPFFPGVCQRAAAGGSRTVKRHARGGPIALNRLVSSSIGDHRYCRGAEFLNAIISTISYENISGRISRYVLWPTEFSISAA